MLYRTSYTIISYEKLLSCEVPKPPEKATTRTDWHKLSVLRTSSAEKNEDELLQHDFAQSSSFQQDISFLILST